jgi:uncharacterized protein
MNAEEIIATLRLLPHPEGGHYRQTWADEAGTAIYFLLKSGDISAWHRVHGRSEIWHFYAGAPLKLETDATGPGSGATSTVRLGADLVAAEEPQAVVPPGVWQRARSLGDWTLVGCTVSPPFTFEAFELAPDQAGGLSTPQE